MTRHENVTRVRRFFVSNAGTIGLKKKEEEKKKKRKIISSSSSSRRGYELSLWERPCIQDFYACHTHYQSPTLGQPQQDCSVAKNLRYFASVDVTTTSSLPSFLWPNHFA